MTKSAVAIVALCIVSVLTVIGQGVSDPTANRFDLLMEATMYAAVGILLVVAHKATRRFLTQRRAVLALHRPETYTFLDGRTRVTCCTCSHPVTARAEPYPCPTARALGIE